MPDHEDLKKMLHAVLDERARWPNEEHNQHHDWVKSKIKSEEARAAFFSNLAAKSLPAIVWALLAAAGAAVVRFWNSHVNIH